MSKSLSTQILVYIIIAYGITWTFAFSIYAAYQREDIGFDKLHLYHSFAAIGPAISALITLMIFYGRSGVQKLLVKIGFPRLGKSAWMLVLSPFFFFIVGFFVYALVKSEWYSFAAFADTHWNTSNTLLIWLLPLLTYPIFEELGWRGFLLPILQESYNAWKSTIILSLVWALWHLPFFFYRFDFSIGMTVGFFFGIFVGSIILTSIYNASHGYLLPAILFHFLNNLFSEFDKEFIVAVLSSGFVFIAFFIFKRYGKHNLSKINRTKNYFTQ